MSFLNKHSHANNSKLGVLSALKLLGITAVTFLIYAISFTRLTVIMSSPEEVPNAIPIQITLSDISSTESGVSQIPIINLKVTLYNKSDKPITFLRWSSPLDVKAAAMGIFVFTPKNSDTPAQSLNLKLNRKLPGSGVFPPDDTIRIEAGGIVEREVEIKAPEVILAKGEKYAVSVKGWWMHVKLGSPTELKTKDSDVLQGFFDSAAVDFEVPS